MYTIMVVIYYCIIIYNRGKRGDSLLLFVSMSNVRRQKEGEPSK